ncbi:MAG: MFS transporter [Sulfuritalea sp.]|nr:MFS transporter [Sulfuritalea sp.]
MTPVGLTFSIIQFLFVTCWTVYVIFLPQLAEQAGIEKRWVIFILMADQVVFALMDYSMGVAADRVLRGAGRLGPLLVWATAISCGAFLLLPFLAPTGSAALFLVGLLVWAMTSSALRAPPMVMLGKYAPAPTIPWVSTLTLFGMGLAGAFAPYLTVSLRGVDPRLPFALSSIALVAAVSGLLWAEKHLQREVAAEAATTRPVGQDVLLFFCRRGPAGPRLQCISLNSAPLYPRFAKPADLEYLMPVFWIGFNLLIFPACRANERFGGVVVMAAGSMVGAIASWLSAAAPSLEALLVLQFLTGGAWAAVLMSAMTAAIAIGHVGREGAATGGLFSLLAIATLARIVLVATQLTKDPAVSAMLVWVPAATWVGAGLLLAWLILRQSGLARQSAS